MDGILEVNEEGKCDPELVSVCLMITEADDVIIYK